MKTLILHLGLQKTGSTSIQETLFHNPAPLEQAGWRYGQIDWMGHHNSNHSFPLIVAFSDGWQTSGEIVRRGWSPEGLKDHFTGQVMAALDSSQNLILSGEDITDIPEEGLQAFARLARDMGFDLKPVMFVRSPLEFITSMSQTRVRHGWAYHVFKAVKSPKIEMCLRLWPDMFRLAFAQALKNPEGPLGVMLDTFGLPPAASFNVIRQNESLSEYATRIIGHVNARVPLFQNGAVNPLRQYLDTDPLIGLPGPKYRLTRAEFLEIREMVQRENATFERLLGPEFCDPSFQFSERPLPWTEAALEALATAMHGLSPLLQDTIRDYFRDPALASRDEAALAEEILA